MMSLPNLAGDGATEAMLIMAQCHCQVMLVMIYYQR
jgi:hypothetical protein